MKYAIILLLLASPTLSSFGEEIRGKVIGISDGDTITVLDAKRTQHRIRLQGIDAPETGQPFGTKCKQHLSSKVYGQNVTVTWSEKDRYDRILGEVAIDKRNINVEMVADGAAWHYKRYSDSQELAEAEEKARKTKRGLWADKPPTPPWEYRI